MFQRHVADSLAALLDGQLPPADAARATEHLARCAACRASRDRVEFAAGLMPHLTLVEAPASIWDAIDGAMTRGVAPGVSTPRPASVDAPRWLAWAAALVIAASAVVFWQVSRTTQESPWDVVRLDTARGESRLPIGTWIETRAADRARIRIGEIGTVDIAPNTRVLVVQARPDEHRLNLARGRISAEIQAPPRLFFVNTPASTVVDLGCAYTMDVDEAGTGTLRVTGGWASLEWEGRESIVPAGASCPTRPDVGPGTPAFDDAPEALRRALLAFDFEGGGKAALDVVLAQARVPDTLTLWHLLSRVEPAERVRVFERMVELGPLPPGVTRDAVLALDADALRRWREELAWTW